MQNFPWDSQMNKLHKRFRRDTNADDVLSSIPLQSDVLEDIVGNVKGVDIAGIKDEVNKRTSALSSKTPTFKVCAARLHSKYNNCINIFFRKCELPWRKWKEYSHY